jgi:hypothetical protein
MVELAYRMSDHDPEIKSWSRGSVLIGGTPIEIVLDSYGGMETLMKRFMKIAVDEENNQTLFPYKTTLTKGTKHTAILVSRDTGRWKELVRRYIEYKNRGVTHAVFSDGTRYEDHFNDDDDDSDGDGDDGDDGDSDDEDYIDSKLTMRAGF